MKKWFCLVLLVVFPNLALSDIVYQNYVIFEDKGWDILCDPYVVKKNDWVLKIFKQKGELSYSDFSDFLSIFARLNPKVKDVNRIRPGWKIYIPLKKILPEERSNYNSTRFTIPIISLRNEQKSQISDSMSMEYIVKKGDCVSILIAKKFGNAGTAKYNRGLSIFKQLNPHVSNLDRIYIGQSLTLPSTDILKPDEFEAAAPQIAKVLQKEKASASEKSEAILPKIEIIPDVEIKTIELPQKQPIKGEKLQPAQIQVEPPIKKSLPQSSLAQNKQTVSSVATVPEINSSHSINKVKKALIKPPPQKISTVSSSLFETVSHMFDGKLKNKGSVFFPQEDTDVEFNLKKTPVVELPGGDRIIFNLNDALSKKDQKVIKSFWKNSAFISVSTKTSLPSIVKKISDFTKERDISQSTSFTDQGIEVIVYANWVYFQSKNDHSITKICNTIINHPNEMTPNSIRRYLAQHDISLNEILRYENIIIQPDRSKIDTTKPYINSIQQTEPSTFVKELLAALSLDYEEDITLTFEFAGIEINTNISRINIDTDNSIYIDFGNLKPEALSIIKNNDFEVIQFRKKETPFNIIKILSEKLSLLTTENPKFRAAKRVSPNNTIISIPGFLLINNQKVQYLLTHSPLHYSIIQFLAQQGIHIIMYNL